MDRWIDGWIDGQMDLEKLKQQLLGCKIRMLLEKLHTMQ